MKTLMVLGAGPLQLPSVVAAKRMGLRVVALDGDPNAPGLALADSARVVNILDPDACLQIAREERPDGVIHICSEVAMAGLGLINRELGLHGPDPEVVVRATNKDRMRRAFEAAGAPSPKSATVSTEVEAVDIARQFHGAIILKPTRNSGSRGVQRLKETWQDAEVAAAFRRALRESRDPGVLIEQFVEGPEFSVEILCFHGEHHVLAVTDKQTTGEPFFVETGHSQPTGLSARDRERVVEAALAGVQALGIDWSAAHAEVRLSPEGPFLIEIGARLGGDFITTELVPLSTGIDMVSAAIQIALGEAPNLRPAHAPQGAAIRYLTPEQGRVIAIDGMEEARNSTGVKVLELSTGVGAIIPEITSSLSRVGHVIAEGLDARMAVQNAEHARDLVRIKTVSSETATLKVPL